MTRTVVLQQDRADITKLGALKRLTDKDLSSRLQSLGAVKYDLWLPETHILPSLIYASETIEGVIYGKYSEKTRVIVGRGCLVATDKRVLFIDKKPLFIRCDEMPYKSISGITYSRVGLIGIVTLFTKIDTISIRTLNQNCARIFVEAIEKRILADQWAGAYE